MHRKIRFLIIFIVLIASIGIAYADNNIAYFSPYPKDISLFISRPEISLILILNNNKIEKIDMKLNGTSVDAKYDEQRKMVVYKPLASLASGTHRVDLEVHISGWSNFLSQSWSFTINDNAMTGFPAVTNDQKSALDYVNSFRSKLGLTNLTMNNSLNAAANSHTNYMIANSRATHDELQGNKNYSGGTPFVRAKVYGYNGIGVSENVSSGFTDITKAMEEFIAAPYHRLAWLDPYANDFGYAGKAGYHTVLFGSLSRGEERTVTYPYNNQINVPLSWTNLETPNPLRNSPDNSVGFPITISHFSNKIVKSIGVNRITLKNDSGRTIKTYILSPQNDEYLTDSIIIIPADPLESFTQYSVSAAFTAYYEDGSSSEKFSSFNFMTKNERKFAFNDISNHWAVETLDLLGKEGILTPRDNNNFRPDVAITRSEFSLFISKMLKLNTRSYEGIFNDVAADMPNGTYIEAAQRYGIISGFPDGTFRPNELMTREQIAVVMRRAYVIKKGITTSSFSNPIYYTDISKIKDWSIDSVRLCSRVGIIKGRDDGSFDPEGKTTRAEAAVMIDRLMKAIR